MDKPSRIGFQPVNPWKHSELSIQARHLPHLQTPDATYFVTFRCAKNVELQEQTRDLVMSAVTHWHGKRIDLDAAVIMPDHVHMIFRIIAHFNRQDATQSVGHNATQGDRQDACPTLNSILHSIKSFSANEVNKRLKRKGTVWQDESFDHIIRNEDEWNEKVEYIRQNAVKKGLVKKPEDYKWLWIGNAMPDDRLEACPTKMQKEVGQASSLSPIKASCLSSSEERSSCCLNLP